MSNEDTYGYQIPSITAVEQEWHQQAEVEPIFQQYCWWCGVPLFIDFVYDGLCPGCRWRIQQLIEMIKTELKKDE